MFVDNADIRVLVCCTYVANVTFQLSSDLLASPIRTRAVIDTSVTVH